MRPWSRSSQRAGACSQARHAVELRFSETVTPGAIRLIDGAGRARDDTRISASGALVTDFEQITLEDELDVTLQ